MRKLAPYLLLAAILSFVPAIPAPVGPRESEAMDVPAFYDAGSLVATTDAGTVITIDTYRKASWQAAIRCEGTRARYRFCEDSTVSTTPTCAANAASANLDNNKTIDIPVPQNFRWFSLMFPAATSDDGGTPGCFVHSVIPRTLPE